MVIFQFFSRDETNQVQEEAEKEVGPDEIARILLNKVLEAGSEVEEEDQCNRENPGGKHPPKT